MPQIITHITSDGKLDLPPELLKKLIGKEIKIEVDYAKRSSTKEYDIDDLIDLLENGPKVNFDNDTLTREWIHERDDGYLYR